MCARSDSVLTLLLDAKASTAASPKIGETVLHKYLPKDPALVRRLQAAGVELEGRDHDGDASARGVRAW